MTAQVTDSDALLRKLYSRRSHLLTAKRLGRLPAECEAELRELEGEIDRIEAIDAAKEAKARAAYLDELERLEGELARIREELGSPRETS